MSKVSRVAEQEQAVEVTKEELEDLRASLLSIRVADTWRVAVQHVEEALSTVQDWLKEFEIRAQAEEIQRQSDLAKLERWKAWAGSGQSAAV